MRVLPHLPYLSPQRHSNGYTRIASRAHTPRFFLRTSRTLAHLAAIDVDRLASLLLRARHNIAITTARDAA